MKRLFLLTMLGGLLGWPPAQAQVRDSTRYWGGTVNLNGNTEKSSANNTGGSNDRTNSSHSITPEIQWGKFINPTTMIGLGVRYGFNWDRSKSEAPSSPGSGSKDITVRQSVALLPFIRKYRPLGERWAVFLHAEVGPTYNWQKYKFKSNYSNPDPQKIHNWQYELGVKPGLVYFIPKRSLAIEGYANVLSLSASYNSFGENSGRQFLFATGLSTNFPSYFTIRISRYLSPKNS